MVFSCIPQSSPTCLSAALVFDWGLSLNHKLDLNDSWSIGGGCSNELEADLLYAVALVMVDPLVHTYHAKVGHLYVVLRYNRPDLRYLALLLVIGFEFSSRLRILPLA